MNCASTDFFLGAQRNKLRNYDLYAHGLPAKNKDFLQDVDAKKAF